MFAKRILQGCGAVRAGERSFIYIFIFNIVMEYRSKQKFSSLKLKFDGKPTFIGLLMSDDAS